MHVVPSYIIIMIIITIFYYSMYMGIKVLDFLFF